MNKVNEETVAMEDQEKQGGKCCGGCCDYRRAVIILCIISLVFAVVSLIGPAVGGDTNTDIWPELNEIQKKYDDMLFIVGIVHIVMTVIALVGAVIFNFFMVLLYVVWSTINLILTIVLSHMQLSEMFDWFDAQDDTNQAQFDDLESAVNTYAIFVYSLTTVFTLLWVYPSVFLAVEIKKGIMTKETYPREEMSCCCVSK